MAKIITPNNAITEAKPKGSVWSLEELQKIVGGYIEIVNSIFGGCLVINEEGKLHGLPLNMKATELYGIEKNDPIVGNVLYVPQEEMSTLV